MERKDQNLPEIITPIPPEAEVVEFLVPTPDTNKNLVISNNSLNINLNVNIDKGAVDLAMQKSAEAARKIATFAVALLAQSDLLKKVDKTAKPRKAKVGIKIPPRVRVPKL